MPSLERRKALLTTIIRSRTFQRIAPTNGRLLMYLAEHSGREDHHLRTEAKLLDLEFLKVRQAKMSVVLARLQDSIDRYFAEEGRGEDHEERLYINRGKDVDRQDPLHNAVLYRPNISFEEMPRRFWKPHLTPGRDTHIAYGLPLFTRRLHKTYGEVLTRRLSENFERDTVESHPSEKVCWPLVRLGDILCVMHLTKWLGEREVGISTEWYRAGDLHYHELKAPSSRDNVIVVGAPRVNGLFNIYQSPKLPFRMDVDVIRAGPGGPASEKHFKEERLEGTTIVPTLITRTSGRSSGAVTMIASAHGRAVEHVSRVLTDEPAMVELFQHPKLQAWGNRLPDQFQMLFAVTVMDDELAAARHEIVDAWPASEG